MTDLELLKQYGEGQSQEAFAELVRRHLEWVYGAAARQVHDRELAEDVAQGVFLALAGRAKSLGGEQALSPWLLRVTRCAAISALRAVNRRQRHEQRAAVMRPESTTRDSETQWEEVSPLLDEQVLRLGKKDQEAILLRFYERKSLAEVGEAMGIGEEAARKRVERAVGKLRGMLGKKGVTGTTAGLSAVLVGNVVEKMPENLVERIVSAVGNGGGSTVAAGFAKGAMKMMAYAKIKVVAVVVRVAALGGSAAIVATVVAADRPATVAKSPASQPVADAAPANITPIIGTWQSTKIQSVSGRPYYSSYLITFRTAGVTVEAQRAGAPEKIVATNPYRVTGDRIANPGPPEIMIWTYELKGEQLTLSNQREIITLRRVVVSGTSPQAKFDRNNMLFTDPARNVMTLANQEAARLNHDYIGTEHILLGLVEEQDSVAATVLKDLGADLPKVRVEVEKLVKGGPDKLSMEQRPQTPRAKMVIEYAMDKANNLNHKYVGTEHLLLGLLDIQDGIAAQALLNLGLKPDTVRAAVLKQLRSGVETQEDQQSPGKGKPATP